MRKIAGLFLALAVVVLVYGGLCAETAKPVKAFDSANFSKDAELKIQRITPEGNDVPSGRQVVLQFDRPVVPLGRMARSADEVPVTITPELNCEWRWLNTSALACQLKEADALTPATQYKVVVAPGLRTDDGVVMTGEVTHRFITQRPKVRRTRFRQWRAPGWPVIQVTFNQPVSRSSIEQHMRFFLPHTGKYPLLKAEPDEQDRETPRYLPLPGEPLVLDTRGASAPARPDDRPTRYRGEEARRIWVVAPRGELPLDTGVHLIVEPGLVSALGPQKGIEDRTVVTFDTFPEFRFSGVSCTDSTTRKRITLAPGYTSADSLPTGMQRCDPLNSVSLVFTAPVVNQVAKAHLAITPDLAGGRKDYDPWANAYSYSYLTSSHQKGRQYHVHLPERLKAFQRYTLVSDAEQFRDEFGRTLSRPIDMAFMTDHRQPNMVLVHNTAVLEKGVDSDVALYVTNLDKIFLNQAALTTDGPKPRETVERPVADAPDTAFAMPLGVRDLLGGRSGVVTGYLDSQPRVPYYDPDNYRFFAQVTPFQVHVKLGHFNSLVWVTDMTSGEPVADARVSIATGSYDDPMGRDPQAGAVTGADGVALLPGIETLDPKLQTFSYYYYRDANRFIVRVQKGADMALVPLDDNFMIWPGGVGIDARPKDGHLHAWGTTAQGVYKAGDTLQYKIYVRNQSNRQWIAPQRKGYSLQIIDPKGQTVAEIKDLTLSEFGTFDGEYVVPRQAAVGWYRFMLHYEGLSYDLHALRVLVSDFTPAPFRASTDLNGDRFQPGDHVEVTTRAALHAGGPYTGADTRITATLKKGWFRSKHAVARNFYFDSGPHGGRSQWQVFQTHLTGNDQGEVVAGFDLPRQETDQQIVYGRMVVEGAVRDDRGKYVAAAASADYFGRDRFVGLRNTRWTYKEDKPAEVQYLVADMDGQPVAGVPVQLLIQRQETKASRVKGAGNAYLTNYVTQWVDVARVDGRSTTDAAVCRFTPPDPGYYQIIATIQDTRSRTHQTTMGAWVVGQGDVVWQEEDNYNLQIVPEKESYNVGDTARFLVKNPFPGAMALITVERYGVVAQLTQTLKGSTPVVELPIEADYLPGFYLSVSVVSPRVDKPVNAENVDLGKPAFRLGYLKIPVKDPYKAIDIQVSTDKEVYKPRQTVKARIKAAPRHGAEDQPMEIAVAVIDEAVFDLNSSGRNYYDPYHGFNRLDDLDLNNYSLLARIVGRQRFEKKGQNQGGGGPGGSDPTLRNLFKFVCYWNPAIRLDRAGQTDIEFEVPDNLTGWRIFALAVTPDDRMGLGDVNFKVNRPTELRPVMPNQVLQGDTFQAGFSVMNRTGDPRKLEVALTAGGDALAGDSDTQATLTVALAPFKRQTVWLPVKTKDHGEIRFTATAKDNIDGDALTHTVPVLKRRSLLTAANYGTTTQASVTDKVAFPQGIHKDAGGISVVASPSVIGNVAGAFGYMRDYPYLCWEQRLTKGVMASHYLNLKAYMPDDFKWPESDTLVRQTLDQAADFQAPNGGMVYWIPDDLYVSPYLSAYTALAFNWLQDSGYQVPDKVAQKLYGYLERLLREDVLPTFYTSGMASSVRAVALAALARQGKITLSDLLRYQPHVAEMDLFGKAHFVMAAMQVKRGRKVADDTARLMLSHSSQSGGKFQFNEVLDDSYSYILATPLRSNSAILSSLLQLAVDDEGLALAGDIPFKMVRAITQSRGSRDHWQNTQENIFCLNALIDYSRVYEKETPDMTVKAYIGQQLMGQARFTDLRDEAVTLTDPQRQVEPGLKTEVRLEKQGPGRLYYATRVQYAPTEDNAERINAGIEIRREYAVERDGRWVLLQSPMQIQRGELVRVDLFISLPTLRHFVVVDDPVPGGLEPVNRDLATASVVDADKGGFKAAADSWWFHYSDWSWYGRYGYSFYHKELRHFAARFYADYLPAGNYHLSYTAQAIAEGRFSVMPVHAEEMYDPDVFGKGLPGTLVVDK